nr:hypothetical protein [Zoogloea sp.]
MGNIVEQTSLGADQGLDLLGHPVKILGQIGDLVAPPAKQRPHPGIQPPLGHGSQGPAQAADGLGQIPRQQGAEEHAGHQAGHDGQPRVRRRAAPPEG